MRQRGHIPEEDLDEYQAIRNATQAADQLEHWYLSRGRTPPPAIRHALTQLRTEGYKLQTPLEDS